MDWWLICDTRTSGFPIFVSSWVSDLGWGEKTWLHREGMTAFTGIQICVWISQINSGPLRPSKVMSMRISNNQNPLNPHLGISTLGSTGHRRGGRALFHSPCLWLNQPWSVTSCLRYILKEIRTKKIFPIKEWPEWQRGTHRNHKAKPREDGMSNLEEKMLGGYGSKEES